ncbi:MAG: HAMP domain-containing histidine kinase [Eggerthellaceae bacterium]|nr:HAMP domain-containing histidine kinase [Eggerthellaceae bacterium]MDR2721465.1 HAMP domain-containing histidine kinase [Coriobacteriaceae bacterium]
MSNKQNTTIINQKERLSQRIKWKSLSYSRRLTISFALIAAMTALVAIGVVSYVWEQHFRTYTTENIQILASKTAEQIAEEYRKTNDLRSSSVPARYASLYANGIGVKVVQKGGDKENVVYDSTVLEFSEGNTSPSLEPKAPIQTKTADIIVDGESVGYVRIWVYGTDTLLRATDEQFRKNSYQAIIFASALAIVLAMCLGFLFARNLVNPINRMTKTAQAIKNGNLSARTELTGDDEIARLGATFDAMADSVEHDRELERRLTTDVAHELRTPLMAIQSTVEAIVDGVFAADTERLEIVNSEVERLARLVDALLRLARLENRNTRLNEEVIDVGELVSGIVVTHEAFVDDSGLTMTFQADKNVHIFGDADMISQATTNLISNAVRYTPEGGHIGVRVKQGELMASIAVQDTGIGLTPEEAKMVFSRFWRADAGRSREHGGLGVGLAVVKEIVDRHGGWVQVEGKPNQGATFTIHIPLYNEATAKSRARSRDKKPKWN